MRYRSLIVGISACLILVVAGLLGTPFGLWGLLAIQSLFRSQPDTITVSLNGVDELPALKEVLELDVTDPFGMSSVIQLQVHRSQAPALLLPEQWRAGTELAVHWKVRDLRTCQVKDFNAKIPLYRYGVDATRMYVHVRQSNEVEIEVLASPENSHEEAGKIERMMSREDDEKALNAKCAAKE